VRPRVTCCATEEAITAPLTPRFLATALALPQVRAKARAWAALFWRIAYYILCDPYNKEYANFRKPQHGLQDKKRGKSEDLPLL